MLGAVDKGIDPLLLGPLTGVLGVSLWGVGLGEKSPVTTSPQSDTLVSSSMTFQARACNAGGQTFSVPKPKGFRKSESVKPNSWLATPRSSHKALSASTARARASPIPPWCSHRGSRGTGNGSARRG